MSCNRAERLENAAIEQRQASIVFKAGTRVKSTASVSMVNDTRRVPVGTEGTVERMGLTAGIVWVHFDGYGRTTCYTTHVEEVRS